MAKDRDYIQLIHAAQWVRLRKEVLTRHPLCQDCEAAGRIEAATEVHHVRPVEEAINYAEKRRRMYDPHNLRALCHACHVRVHTELGRSGKEATKRINAARRAEILRRFFGEEE